MRKIVVRSSNILLTLAGIGILTMILGVIYFSGAGGIEGGLFYGFNYGILLAFGFYLSLIGFFPVLTSLDASAKNTVKKFNPHLLLITGIGVIFLIYSALVPHILAPLTPSHTWFDYYILGAVLIIFGFSTILLAVRDRERLWNFKIILFLIFVVGILVEITSLLTYFGLLEFIDIGKSMWLTFYLFGGVILFIGMIPLLISASSRFRGIIHRLRFILILIALIGIIAYIIPTLALNEILPLTVFDFMNYYDFLLFGSLAIVIGLLLLSASDRAYDFIYKLRFVWLLLLFAGTIQLIISFVLVLPTSEFIGIPQLESIPFMTISDFPATYGMLMLVGMTWDVYYVNGIIMTFISIIFICSIVFFESEEVSVDIGALMAVEGDKLPGIDTTPSEMLTYLEIVNRSQVEMIKYFKEAVRQDRFRPRIFEAISKQYQDLNKLIKAKINDYREKVPSSAKFLFDAALSEEPTITPSVPEEKVTPAPTPPPSGPPPSPPIPPSAPSIPSPPPAAPPSAPVSPPALPAQSSLDLIADARSTSIAELRGEMLKELSRLREIFKE
ncbi:MAG: hypothetical protein JSU57_06410 [Candidatus Heimdallarchaeota archaeon]|nr:MAG: hypothetical protein JSU57_06410 [Candidatus Heimdallarchaeota archaeon]